MNMKGLQEITAATMIQQLGYKVVIVPEAEINYQADPSSYTMDYARQVLTDAVMTRYAAERNLFIPMSYVPTPAILSQPRLWRLYRKAKVKVLILQTIDLAHRAFRR